MSEKQMLAIIGSGILFILALAFLIWMVFFGGINYIQNLVTP